MVMLNVFVAVVLKNFEDQIEASTKTLQVPTDCMDEFEKLWIKFAESDGERMKISRLGTFLNLLREPLGLLSEPLFGQELVDFIEKLEIPQVDGFVHYIDLGTILTLRVFEQNEKQQNISLIPEENEFMKHIRYTMFRKFPKFKSFKERSSTKIVEALADD